MQNNNDNLRITIVQTSLQWENVKANLDFFEQELASKIEETDLILLPEMFTTGFSMNAEQLAESINGKTMQWMAAQAQQYNTVVAGSFIAKENEKFYNRLIWMQPDGNYQYYDKRHLFTMANEHLTYEAGTKKLIVEWRGWKICPLICYDLRFPVWSRNAENYDLLIYLANWPVTRSFHWKSLLQARAIENQSFTVGVNCVGKDGGGYYYTGDSCILSPAGEWLFQAADRRVVHTQTIHKEDLIALRKKLPFLADIKSKISSVK
ncbi:MAG: amidohydrolase [Bacteroidota bacterium]